jgi:serine/threonine protein kinase
MHNDCGGQAVHCDTKPSDVLLDGDMTAKVGDFGVTRLMAPVQLEQQSISSVQGLTGSIVYNPPGTHPNSSTSIVRLICCFIKYVVLAVSCRIWIRRKTITKGCI